jgi:hypothetical protein
MSFDPFQKRFFCRIAEYIDSDRSSLYEVPISDRAVGVPIIVERQAAFAALPKRPNFRWLFQSFG